MTWQLPSFGLLAIALAAGFAWYERTRPSSKVLALVATLAALGALGRVAFAPLPSVKPTTDIVLIAGYVLGGAPGFVVGAVSAIASNVFFGQGPFTPWQMAGWGAVGLFGALLARTVGPSIGRWPLATACAFAGFAYGSFLDFQLWVLYAGQHNWAEYAVLAGRGLPFNIAHAAGNVVFCLAFGPLLVRALRRYRDRLEITWHPLSAGPLCAIVALVLAAAALAGAGPGAGSARAADRSVTKAVSYLRGAQNGDGGFGAGGGGQSTQLYTSWAAIGLAAAGHHPAAIKRSGRSPITYMMRGIGQIQATGDLERTILALRAAGRSAQPIAGRHLVSDLGRRQRGDGSYGGLVNQTAFAILAQRAAGHRASGSAIRRAAAWLAREHNGDGGFNFSRKGGQSGIDDTAAALQALVAAGKRSSKTAHRAASFLAAHQNADGGMALSPGAASNAQSTAWAVQGLVAAGRNPAALHRHGARSPLTYLRSLQNGSGSFRYSRTSRQTPVWVTAQVLTALMRRPFPIRR